jgi:hypothetical protein
MRRSGIGTVIYLIIGLVIAVSHHYMNSAGTLKAILSAVLAIGLWPLVLLGINLHVR